jgi:hypothetical protein
VPKPGQADRAEELVGRGWPEYIPSDPMPPTFMALVGGVARRAAACRVETTAPEALQAALAADARITTERPPDHSGRCRASAACEGVRLISGTIRVQASLTFLSACADEVGNRDIEPS